MTISLLYFPIDPPLEGPELPNKKTFPRISELDSFKKGHLAFLIDQRTGLGIHQASAIARGDYGDYRIDEAFLAAGDGWSPHRAKINARKVMGFPDNNPQAAKIHAIKRNLKYAMLNGSFSDKNARPVFRALLELSDEEMEWFSYRAASLFVEYSEKENPEKTWELISSYINRSG